MRYQSTTPKRRFLAGVKCPKCDVMDGVVQIQLFEPIADEYIECTQCGHSERRPDPIAIQEKNIALDETLNNGITGIVKFKP